MNTPVYPVYVAGHFCETDRPLNVVQPFDGKILAQTFMAGEKEYEEAVAAAQAVREPLKEWPSYKRAEVLMQIAISLKNDRERLAKILAAEAGKPYKYAIAEIDRAAQTFLIASEESKRIPAEYLSLDWTPAGEKKEGWVRYFPSGIVAGIAPFNFPMNLAVHKIAPAIAAGCPIILKPASSTPLSTLELARIIDQTELPKGAVSILPMDRVQGNKLVTDDRFSLLSFTGSPVVGWEMKKNAGRKKVVLELGGNAGVIVSASAKLEDVVPKAMNGAFAYAGQICIHAQRFFVHESLFGDFVKQLCEKAAQLRFGDPVLPETDISPMIDEANAVRVENWINEAVASGATILCGGKRNGNYVEPTIITGTNPKMKVCAEEIFGPVITVEKYNSFSDAVKMINDTVFGLQAGVFTNDISEMNQAFSQIETGGIILNDVPTFRVDHMPYGGIKESGLGREGVRYAMMDMLEPKILVKPTA